MRRALGLIMITGLFLGATACGSSGGSDSKSDTKSTTETGSDDGGGETASGNEDVQAYCEAVDDYVAKAKDAMNDPAKAQAMTDEAKELSEKAAALGTAGLDSDDAQAVADCTKKSTEALMPG